MKYAVYFNSYEEQHTTPWVLCAWGLDSEEEAEKIISEEKEIDADNGNENKWVYKIIPCI